ncbi:molecular chaperone TorD family protein [Desulfovibrio sp. Huiquan2017]|uniref:TorD/DmsD family molecular chaperone n=1 Tax=Desulfovibrio sp. Huiquan2017 TaxID=2816861 RepID=UPI001A930819|nr:molecular chaperone TorD family protein [Desulfovibrio sp. Huiquan2017]
MSISQSNLFLLKMTELCAAVFRGPSEQEWAQMATHAVPELLDRVQEFPGFPADAITAFGDALASYADIGFFSALEAEYVRLFIAAPGGVPVPLYESCHSNAGRRVMGASSLAMRDRLTEVGLEVGSMSNEPPDHLSLELEYLFHLCSKGWTDEPGAAEQGARFAGEVMLPWVSRFREALAAAGTEAGPGQVYLAGADLVLALLTVVAEG